MSWISNLGQSIFDVAKPVMSIIPGVGNYLGSMEQSDAVKDANEKNLQATRETNAANLALWEKQTEYNKPINQMQRLRDAGLNPNLAYGQVADSKMAVAPTMAAPHYQAAPGRQYSGFSLADYQQVMNNMEQNKLIRAQKQEVEARATGQNIDNVYRAWENSKLMESGMLKNEPVVTKNIRAAGRLLGDYIGGTIKRTVNGVKWGVSAPVRLFDYVGPKVGPYLRSLHNAPGKPLPERR